MLESLYIENFAIIDKIQLDFHRGMTVITGETGAGKSIIIDAIGQLLGQRTQSEFVKKGKKSAFIEGVFSYDESMNEILEDYHLNSEDGTLVVSKMISAEGKSLIKVNYRQVTLAILKQIMPALLDIHSQFQTHQLFQNDYHIQLLDRYIQDDLTDIKLHYSNVMKQYRQAKKKYESLTLEEMSDEQYDYYLNQCDEIDVLNLENFDEDAFMLERKLMMAFEKNALKFKNFEEYYNGYDSILTRIKDSLSELSHIDDKQVQNYYEKLYDTYYALDEVSNEVISYYHSFSFDEEHFNEIQNTYYALNKLKRKYGNSIEQILSYRHELDEKIALFQNREEMISSLNDAMLSLRSECLEIAGKMSQIRQNYARQLEKQVHDILQKVYLPNVQFEFRFTETELSANGIDDVVIYVSTNAGQVPMPLQKVASGGEISRIMLAIKTACLKSSGQTIIFDEADTGVSGKVAEGVGHIMKDISQTQQVICITHLPQVAGFAHHHLHVEKHQDDQTTSTTATYLDYDSSVEEIAKMISGKNVTQESMQHAKNLKQG